VEQRKEGRKIMKHDELPVFQKWTSFLGWLFDVTQKFPRRTRFTFASRLDNLGLDVLEKIIEAAYTKDGLVRFMRKIRAKERLYNKGCISEDELVRSAESLTGHVRHGNTKAMRQTFFNREKSER
jgi:hypothetical protein